MTQPVLTTKRLLLEPATFEDLDLLWALWTIPDVLRYLFDGATMTRDEARDHLAQGVSQNNQGRGLWMIHSRDDRTFLGEIGLEITNDLIAHDAQMENEVEFQIALHPDGWGKGYGEEALTALLRYAFDTLQLPYVMGVADAPNKGSRRLQEKMGFVWQREVEGEIGKLVIYKRERD